MDRAKEMIQGGEANQIALIAASAIPLFYGSGGLLEAGVLSTSVLFAVFIFEGFYILAKRFLLRIRQTTWRTRRVFWRALRPLLALVVLAFALSGIFLITEPLLKEKLEEIRFIFPLTFASAYLLSYATMTVGSFGVRIRIWSGFLILLLIIGILREPAGAFQMFIPAPFWVGGVVMAAFMYFEKKRK